MSLILFKHNQKAYEAAAALMEEKGRAAVIHPTGTGKTYIAFKLAKEHSDSRILWLSPSEYIYRTQLEQLQKDGEERFTNISFLTYARLMRNEAVIATLRPDYIVLDEFHRCGAAEWGRSVEKLLAYYPKAKVLGLSATNIRYLDHQRDMAEELFYGQIASEMTLGEAIAKGILPVPTYVISMYSYQKELERIQERMASARNSTATCCGEMLEELRRALEQAEGLDAVFARHMKKKDGKYIVFCSDKEHMEEMVEQAKTWFGLVDKKPHIYTVYYDNSETDRIFAEFKADQSEHLKLLYCIDMLNEGVHVENIDGVILLRPTVSPILYLQQIGRALSAADGKRDKSQSDGNAVAQPIIFDIVNNFDSLYSIDSLQTEIEEAFALMDSTAVERQRFREQFRIVDETRDCKLLFEQLRRSLSAPWDIYYGEAKKYYAEHGNLKIPKDYVTENGISLGIWLMTQRRVRNAASVGKMAGKLTEEQIAKLDAIGMEWECGSVRSWNRACEALERYRKTYGNLDVKVSYVTEDGFALGKWVSNARSRYGRGELSEEQTGQLESLGMIWDKHVMQWEENYQAAVTYYRLHGNLLVPHGYRDKEGIRLGVWIANQRSIYVGKKKGAAPLNESQIERLNAIEMVWCQDSKK